MKGAATAALSLAGLLTLAGCDNTAQWAYESGLSMEKSRAGLADSTVTTDDGIQWHLLKSEGDVDKPVVVLIHGFGADSSNWVRFANELEDEFYFVIPDLPGHGDTTRNLELDYTMASQARRVLGLMQELGIEQFHVAGNSMGGAITLAMAEQAPDAVLSMGLIDAAGLTQRTKEFDAFLADNEGNPLIPTSPEQFRTTLQWAMEDAPYMPDFFINVMGEKKAANAAVARKIWNDLQDDPAMERESNGSLAKLVNEPALVLWGREDRLLAVENVDIFLKELPKAQAVILDGIGHLPMTEAPDDSAKAFRTFWATL